MKLSILICSHESRTPLCCRMLDSLMRQILDYGYLMGAEALVQTNKSVMQRGADRNKLLERATGEYCCFADDDDVVALNYVNAIMRAIHGNPGCDVFGLRGVVVSLSTNESKPFELSSKYSEMFSLPNDNLQDGVFKRYLSHLNPIKTDIAREINFPNEMVHEDNGYTTNLMKYSSSHNLKEYMIPEVLYYYYNRCQITSKGIRA